jgi:hypothetical protein
MRLADHPQCTAWARFYAAAAEHAALLVDPEALAADRSILADRIALEVLVAAIPIEADDSPMILRLWILTPGAVKRTALQEYERANARAVVEAEALNVEYRSGRRHRAC